MVVTFASLGYPRQFSAIGYFMSNKKAMEKTFHCTIDHIAK